MINLVNLIVTKLNLPGIKLTANEIYWLKASIVSNPSIYEDLSKTINTIISDKTISIDSFLQIIMSVISHFKNFDTPQTIMIDVTNIIKFILDTIVETFLPEQLISIPVTKLIDYSLTLLVTDVNSGKLQKCFHGIKCFTCCC